MYCYGGVALPVYCRCTADVQQILATAMCCSPVRPTVLIVSYRMVPPIVLSTVLLTVLLTTSDCPADCTAAGTVYAGNVSAHKANKSHHAAATAAAATASSNNNDGNDPSLRLTSKANGVALLAAPSLLNRNRNARPLDAQQQQQQQRQRHDALCVL